MREGRGLPRFLDQLEIRQEVCTQKPEPPLTNSAALPLQTKGSLNYLHHSTDFRQGKRSKIQFRPLANSGKESGLRQITQTAGQDLVGKKQEKTYLAPQSSMGDLKKKGGERDRLEHAGTLGDSAEGLEPQRKRKGGGAGRTSRRGRRVAERRKP